MFALAVELAFITNEDGFIPTGDYKFSDTKINSPFTLSYGAFSENIDLDGQGIDPMMLTNGIINVLNDGEKYKFTFKLELDSIIAIEGYFSGRMLYSDL